MVSRNIPINVRRELRKEVNFGCPVRKCGNPYLTYHHFDPPFHVEEHHRPEGMIALCAHHHNAAEGGAFTDDQLRALKLNPYINLVEGRFDWLRNNLALSIGGNLFVKSYSPITINGKSIVWFERDDEDYLCLRTCPKTP